MSLGLEDQLVATAPLVAVSVVVFIGSTCVPPQDPMPHDNQPERSGAAYVRRSKDRRRGER